MARPNERIWTEDEDALIHAGALSAYQIAMEIGSEYRVVQRRAQKLGVKLPARAMVTRKARTRPDSARLRRLNREEEEHARPTPDALVEDATKVIVWKPRHGRSALGYSGDDLVPISIPRIKCIHGTFRGRNDAR